ncbi:hypothetical protein [Paraburkholderia diazotrophica]|uniref:hypothetical protein n=1 Tax=Paraburkholderia diazotrophica TaxID=667676 RepID=UPI00115FD567|nr:hypothetical protein [Paraburkholderia diazotrophica]
MAPLPVDMIIGSYTDEYVFLCLNPSPHPCVVTFRYKADTREVSIADRDVSCDGPTLDLPERLNPMSFASSAQIGMLHAFAPPSGANAAYHSRLVDGLGAFLIVGNVRDSSSISRLFSNAGYGSASTNALSRPAPGQLPCAVWFSGQSDRRPLRLFRLG